MTSDGQNTQKKDGNGESRFLENGLSWFSPKNIHHRHQSIKNPQTKYTTNESMYHFTDPKYGIVNSNEENSVEKFDDISLRSQEDAERQHYPDYYCANYRRGIFDNINNNYDALPINTKRIITIGIMCAAVLIGLNLASLGMNEKFLTEQSRQSSQTLRQYRRGISGSIETHHSTKGTGSKPTNDETTKNKPKNNQQNQKVKNSPNNIVIVNGISIPKNKLMPSQQGGMMGQGFNNNNNNQGISQQQMQLQQQQHLGNPLLFNFPMQSQTFGNQFNGQAPIQNQPFNSHQVNGQMQNNNHQLGQQMFGAAHNQQQQSMMQNQNQMQNQAPNPVGGGYVTEEGKMIKQMNQMVEQPQTTQPPIVTSDFPQTQPQLQNQATITSDPPPSQQQQQQQQQAIESTVVTTEPPPEQQPQQRAQESAIASTEPPPEQQNPLVGDNPQVVTEDVINLNSTNSEATEMIQQPIDAPVIVEESINVKPEKDDQMAGFMDGFEGFHMVPLEDVPNDPQKDNTPKEVTIVKDDSNRFFDDSSSVVNNVLIGKPKILADGSLPLDELNHFKDNWDPWERSDVPVFLHIPKAGGSTIKDLMGTCHRFVMATEMGITDGHDDDPEVAVVYPGGGPVGQDRSPFVNVDTTTLEGIARAQEMGFADSGLADAVVTPFIYETNNLFTPTAKGRLFTVFRHPIERAISMFYYIQVADWEPTYDPDLVNWSISQYAQSSKIENNWLTRQLSNQPEGDLSEDNIKIAMEVIRRKFMVGLMTQIPETMERFERFYRWTYHVNPPNQEKCRERLIKGGSNKNSSTKEKPKPGSEEWNLLELQNKYDLQLYQYLEVLFKEQEQFVADIPVGFRLQDATCCKCGPPTFPPEGFTCPLAIMN